MVQEIEISKLRVHPKNVRKTYTNIDELADVRIMERQMEILFQCEEEVERRIDFKVQRQKGRLEKLEAEHGEKE